MITPKEAEFEYKTKHGTTKEQDIDFFIDYIDDELSKNNRDIMNLRKYNYIREEVLDKYRSIGWDVEITKCGDVLNFTVSDGYWLNNNDS